MRTSTSETTGNKIRSTKSHVRRDHGLLRGVRALGHAVAPVRARGDAAVPARAQRGGGGVPGGEVPARVVPVRLPPLGVLPLPLGEPVGRLRRLQAPPVPRRVRGRRRERHAVPRVPGPAVSKVARAVRGAGEGTRAREGLAGMGGSSRGVEGGDLWGWIYLDVLGMGV